MCIRDRYHITFIKNNVCYDAYTIASGVSVNPINLPSTQPETVPAGNGHLGNNVFKIVGKPTAVKKLTQPLNISGNSGEPFVINAWGCGHTVKLKDNRTFGVELEFTYTDGTKESFVSNFSSNVNDWQYLAEVFVPKKNYSNVTAGYTYSYNANTAYFDGLSVFKEEFGPSYTYDFDGNVISVKDLQDIQTTFEYDINNNITKLVNPKGKNFTYTYDDNHNVTSAVTATNVKNAFSYDTYGNPIECKTINPNNTSEFIKTTSEMTSDGNYVTKVTNPFGKSKLTNWDLLKGLVNFSTDENGNETGLSYNNCGQLIMKDVLCTIGGALTSLMASYAYENDRLTTIINNGVTYHLSLIHI